jgi:hypothetical protein
MFLRKYKGNQFLVDTSCWYKLSSNAGISFWRLHSEYIFNFNTILSKLYVLCECIYMPNEVQKTSSESLKWSISNVRIIQKYSFVYKVSVQTYSKCNITCNVRSLSVKFKLQQIVCVCTERLFCDKFSICLQVQLKFWITASFWNKINLTLKLMQVT